jgi:hypothetical protein
VTTKIKIENMDQTRTVPFVWFEPGERPCPEPMCKGRLTLVPW